MGELAVTSDHARPDRIEEGSAFVRPAAAATAASANSRRDRFNGWFVTHEVAWELLMAALAVVYVALGFMADEIETAIERDANLNPSGEIAFAELALTAVFAVEFVARIVAARSRLGYLKGHWIDVIALAPPIRGARVLRLLRLLRLVRAFAGVYRAGLHLQGLARHRGFAWLLTAWLGVMALCSAWMYIAEKGNVRSAIENPFDALWWGVTTLTTVGYGDVVPHTTEGRLAAMCLMLLGIGLFGAITATITSYFITHDLARLESRAETDVALDQTELAHLRTTTVSPAAQSPASASGTLVADLERLAALHRSGDLTAVEFERAKSRLLGAAPLAEEAGHE